MSHNSSWTLTQTGEARTWTLTQDGESRTFTIAPGVGPAGPAGPSNITTSTSTDITGILKGDGANVGAAVADTDYQSVPAEGAFADGDKTKLDGIEAGADVTDATNVNAAGAVMESDYSPAHSVLAQQSGTGSPSAVTLGTNAILGRTTGAGTSITGLSASDVRTMLNVEDGATADQTASEILTAIKTVDGTGSGLDADLLDGQESSAFAAASHTHLSADITDATDDGSIPGDRGNLLKTDSSGQVKAFSVFGDLSIGGGFGLIDGDPDGSFTNYGILVGNNITGGRTIELPDAEGTLALTSQTDGSIHAEDLDFAGSTDIATDLADADEILVSDGGGNTTRRKSALSRVWTYIKAKIESVALSTLEVTGDLTVDTNTLFVNASTDRVGVGIAAPAAKLHVSDAANATFKASSGTRSVNINSYASDWNYQTSLGAPFVFGTQDSQPLYLYTNNTQRLSISNAGSIATGSSSISLNGNPTISGNITASGQIELTGQSASTDDSAMTRSLVATESTLTTPEPIGFSAPTKSGTTFTSQAAYGGASFYMQVSSGATVGHYARVESVLEPWARAGSGAGMELLYGEMSWIFDLYVNVFQSNEARVLIGTTAGKTVLDVAGWGVVFTSASSCKLQSHNGSALSESSALTLNANLGISNYHRFMVVANAGTVYLYQRSVGTNLGALGRWVLIGSLAGSSLPNYSSGTAMSFNNIATGTMGGASNLLIKNPTYLHQAITP